MAVCPGRVGWLGGFQFGGFQFGGFQGRSWSCTGTRRSNWTTFSSAAYWPHLLGLLLAKCQCLSIRQQHQPIIHFSTYLFKFFLYCRVLSKALVVPLCRGDCTKSNFMHFAMPGMLGSPGMKIVSKTAISTDFCRNCWQAEVMHLVGNWRPACNGLFLKPPRNNLQIIISADNNQPTR